MSKLTDLVQDWIAGNVMQVQALEAGYKLVFYPSSADKPVCIRLMKQQDAINLDAGKKLVVLKAIVAGVENLSALFDCKEIHVSDAVREDGWVRVDFYFRFVYVRDLWGASVPKIREIKTNHAKIVKSVRSEQVWYCRQLL